MEAKQHCEEARREAKQRFATGNYFRGCRNYRARISGARPEDRSSKYTGREGIFLEVLMLSLVLDQRTKSLEERHASGGGLCTSSSSRRSDACAQSKCVPIGLVRICLITSF